MRLAKRHVYYRYHIALVVAYDWQKSCYLFGFDTVPRIATIVDWRPFDADRRAHASWFK
jgi:hypothetical protein